VADAIFDEPDGREWGFEGLVVAHNPEHRWYYYPDMHVGEAILFKTKDSDEAAARHIPHVAFNDPSAPGTRRLGLVLKCGRRLIGGRF
jgi:hypothetical protein